jgi:hypothetical protein
MSNEKSVLFEVEEEESGLESEDFGAEIESIEKPFDPRKVDVSISTPNLGALITRLKQGEIDLIPDFQRSGDLWSPQAQSRLIESILIRLPIPAFYFDALDDDKWQVVDGLQRLSAIKNFVVDKRLALTNLEFLQEYQGYKYDELPRNLQRRLDEFQTSVYLIKPGTPALLKYSLFHRINTGGLKLTNQEIRHAMSQSVGRGKASKFLTEIVKEEDFRKVVVGKNSRMACQELVLRHMAFILFGVENYKSSLPRFLDSAMDKLGRTEATELSLLRENFLSSMRVAYEIFKKDAFKKTLLEPKNKKVVNKPLFESVSVQLALIDEDARLRLMQAGDSFRGAFKNMLTDSDFYESISKSTANTENVQTRFRMIKNIIEKYSA